MLNTLDTKSSYIGNDVSKSKKEREAAKAWCAASSKSMVIPSTDLSKITNDWINFNSMTKKERRESDWKSIEIFGGTNQDLYDYYRGQALQQDFDTDIEKMLAGYTKDMHVNESSASGTYIDDYEQDLYDTDHPLNYSTIEVENAIKWSEASNRIIIIPTRTLAELEGLWDAFNSMVFNHRQESDDKSILFFGLTNLKHYEYLKKEFLRQDLRAADVEKYGSVVEQIVNPDPIMKNYYKELAANNPAIISLKSLLELSLPNNSIYQDRIISNIISTAIDTMKDTSEITPNIGVNYGDLPYFTPDELMQMYAEDPTVGNEMLNDNTSVKEWLEQYKLFFNGLYSEFANLSSDWVNKVRTLMFELKKIETNGSKDEIDLKRKAIIELGWNPDVDFSAKNRVIVRNITEYKMNMHNGVTKLIDLRGFVSNNQNIVMEADNAINNTDLHPVYVILTQGKSPFSAVIKGLTHSVYSHASIAFDSKLDNMYSFNAGNGNGIRGGFISENIKDFPNGSRIGLFVFFVKENTYTKLLKFIDKLKENSSKTSYGYHNLLSWLFKIPESANNYSMFCSQFVDRCLKMADINITNKNSIDVTPETFNKVFHKEKRVYSLYDGLASTYNDNIVSTTILSLLNKNPVPIKESSEYLENEKKYIFGIISNIQNVDFLREMANHIDIVKNNSVRKLLQEELFDHLELKDYMDGCSIEPAKPSLDFINSMIMKNYLPL